MWQCKTIHDLKTLATWAGGVAFMLSLAACGGSATNTDAAIVSANSGLSTQLLQNTLTVQAGTEQTALQAAVSTAVWTPSEQLRADVSNYFGQLGPKAFAITPPTETGAQAWGSIHGAATTQEAQNDALQICRNVASQKGIVSPCSILYIENARQPVGWM